MGLGFTRLGHLLQADILDGSEKKEGLSEMLQGDPSESPGMSEPSNSQPRSLSL